MVSYAYADLTLWRAGAAATPVAMDTVIATVPTYNSCTKCVRSLGKMKFGYECMDDLTTEHSSDLQASWVIYVLGLFFCEIIDGCL